MQEQKSSLYPSFKNKFLFATISKHLQFFNVGSYLVDLEIVGSLENENKDPREITIELNYSGGKSLEIKEYQPS